jgi:glycosyltransferase involved in cell wall biosynthesis
MFKNKTYMILTKWCYPFGGGEEFMYQTMSWATALGMNSYWLCFSTAENENFSELLIKQYPFGTIIQIPGGISEETIEYWLKLLNPHFVHHQGHMRSDFYNPCKKLRIEFLTGFHYWHGAFQMNPKKLNIDIIKNSKYHTVDQELINLWSEKYLTYYAVTEFVSECIKSVTGYEIMKHIYSSSSYEKCKIENMDITKNKYVTIINIHKLKGGDIFLHLLKELKNIPFMCIRTEYCSEELDNMIFEEMNSRTDCLVMNRVSDPKLIFDKTRIFIAPSHCDETFCRTVNEAMMNGIPVVTTGQGNISNLVGDAGFVVDKTNLSEWTNVINKLYFDENLLKEYSDKSLKQYEQFSEKKAMELFETVTRDVLLKSKDQNVMIFSPWCDQGLGIQSRNYADILKSTDNYNVFVFALAPYNAESCIELQKNPEEWLTDNIYYSSNVREKITDNEIITFVNKYNIGKCLLPETCFDRVFEIAKLLRSINVKCYAIPNIEIVRKHEIVKHRYFYKILCNNNLCKNIFNNYGVTTTDYVGYGVQNSLICHKPTQYNDIINFIFIGGMNAFSRKHVLEICEGFVNAYDNLDNPNIHLTCTVQLTNELEIESKNKIENYKQHPGITVIQEHMTYKKIIDLYYNNHISIQVSKHEGLGLGFYEALGTGTPIISLDIAPHNELVTDNVNGWLIPYYGKPMTDNKDPIFESAYFDPMILSNKITEITIDFNNMYPEIIKTLEEDFNNRLSINIFKQKFLDSIDV